MQFSYFFVLLAQTKPTAEQVESGFGYVIAAFIAIWLFIAGYLFWLHRRQESLRQEVNILRQETLERLEASSLAQVGTNSEDKAATASRPELGG